MRGKLDETLAAMFSNQTFHKTYMFYGYMLSQCNIKIDRDVVDVAGVMFEVNHYILFINPDGFDKYDLVGRLAILKHEMLHILYHHVKRKQSRNHHIFNISTDCAINQEISPNHLPEDAITPKSIEEEIEISIPLNRSSEEYYDILINNMPKDNEMCHTGIGSHDLWGKSMGDPTHQKDITKKMIQKSQENTIKKNGTVPYQCSEWLELLSKNSEVSWKKVLKNVTGRKKVGKRNTVKKRHRRFPDREDLRGTIKDRIFNLLVVADVSGSMSDEAILKTLAEVKHICKITNTSIDLIQIDTQPCEPEKLSKSTKVIERKGSGGTLLYSAIEKAYESKIEFDAVVVLTDGYVSNDDVQYFEDLKKRVIWLIEPSGTIPNGTDTKRMSSFRLSA